MLCIFDFMSLNLDMCVLMLRRELKEEGKVRWIGFSTHAPAHIIKQTIETDAFDYVNCK